MSEAAFEAEIGAFPDAGVIYEADLNSLGSQEEFVGGVLKLLWTCRERLPMFVVTDHPTDAPDHFVARMWLSLPTNDPQGTWFGFRELSRLQRLMRQLGLVRLDRFPEDNPIILETWL